MTAGGTVTALAARHRWKGGHECETCGVVRRSVQADERDPRSWYRVYRWPDGREVDDRGVGTPACPGARPVAAPAGRAPADDGAVVAPVVALPTADVLAGQYPAGAAVEVRAGTRDTLNRRPPVRGLLVSAYWTSGGGEHEWCDVHNGRRFYDPSGYFGTVPADAVRPADDEARRA